MENRQPESNLVERGGKGDAGSISLLDGTTKQFIGIINPQIGPAQTSYTWSTRSISLSRTNPSGKDVVAGNYVI